MSTYQNKGLKSLMFQETHEEYSGDSQFSSRNKWLAGIPDILPLSIDVLTSRCPSSLNLHITKIISVKITVPLKNKTGKVRTLN